MESELVLVLLAIAAVCGPMVLAWLIVTWPERVRKRSQERRRQVAGDPPARR